MKKQKDFSYSFAVKASANHDAGSIEDEGN